MMSASFASVYVAWGLKPWNKLTFIQARQELLNWKSWYEYFGIWRRKNLSVWSAHEDWIRQLQEWRPALLQGYALTLKLFAEAARKHSQSVARIPLVVSTSGTLDRSGRVLIEQTFRGRVIDVYASEEAGGVIAWQCPVCEEYHVNSENLIVEVIEDGCQASAGRPGRVLITNLRNYTMPFIRYDQGDVAVPSSRTPLSDETPRCSSAKSAVIEQAVVPGVREDLGPGIRMEQRDRGEIGPAADVQLQCLPICRQRS